MDDDAVPMDHAYSYDDDGGLEDDSSSQARHFPRFHTFFYRLSYHRCLLCLYLIDSSFQGAMMTTDKTELELKPGRARQQSLFDPARSLNLGDLVRYLSLLSSRKGLGVR